MSKEKWERLIAEGECIPHGAEGMTRGQAAINLHTYRSGGVYPRPYWVSVNKNRSDLVMLCTASYPVDQKLYNELSVGDPASPNITNLGCSRWAMLTLNIQPRTLPVK